MPKPTGLRPGDTIGIVAPGSPMSPERLEKGSEYLESRGYRVVLGKHVRDQRGYLAGDDVDRVFDLEQMFRDPDISAIFCARGGYGTQRLLDLIDYEIVAVNPKIFVGYSDITALQLAFWGKAGLVSYSGPMPAVEMGLGIDPFTEKIFWQMLEGSGLTGPLPLPEGHELQVLKPGKARGPLVGGCLSLVATLLGTPYAPDFTGAVLFLEDIGEEPYRLDRYLAQLRLAGVFDRVDGVVLGQFLDAEPKGDSPSLTVEEVLRDYFDRLHVPVVANFPYGHGAVKVTMPVGVQVELDTEAGELHLLEPTVEPAGLQS